jgi:SAM-dependent methyltransferase
MDTLYYAQAWKEQGYVRNKDTLFQLIDNYLETPPKRLLDIGCGYARVSQLFQQKYGTELWLLDGDFSRTETISRAAKYGAVEDFKFYVPIHTLKQHWDQQGMRYTFVDANKIDIAADLQFDLVTSWISCGFHYPYQTYHQLILDHTHSDSTVIMDFRRKAVAQQQQDFTIVNMLRGDATSKKQTLHLVPNRK